VSTLKGLLCWLKAFTCSYWRLLLLVADDLIGQCDSACTDACKVEILLAQDLCDLGEGGRSFWPSG
jgi:hypothetical protein